MADVGGFIGLERRVNDYLSVQLGVAGYGDEAFTPQGNIWQFTGPLFATLNYSYKVHHSRVMFSSKLLSTMPHYQAVRPYFSWELGTAYNRASSYQEQPVIPLAEPMAPFANHTQSSFTWGVGVGFDYNVSQHIRAGIGYQFADLGSAALGLSTEETTTQTLSLSHLYTNQLRFQLTYLV